MFGKSIDNTKKEENIKEINGEIIESNKENVSERSEELKKEEMKNDPRPRRQSEFIRNLNRKKELYIHRMKVYDRIRVKSFTVLLYNSK